MSVLVPGTATLVVLTVLALIRQLQTRAFLSLQLAHVLGSVAARGRAVIDDVYPLLTPAGTPIAPGRATEPVPALRRGVTWAGPPGLLQQLDLRRLVAAAAEADAVVKYRVGVGAPLYEGSPLADIHGGDLPDEVVRRTVIRGQERSFDQDPMFAVRLLADIALRALSTGVNDPATAVDTIDATEGLLRTLAGRDLTVTDFTDGAGRIRVRLLLPTWEDYLRAAVEDLLPAAAPSPMVLDRLQQMIENLFDIAAPPARPVLVRLDEQVTARLDAHRRRVIPYG